MASRGIKYLGNILIKEVRDLYSNNYKILLQENKEDLNKQKGVHVHGLRE